MAERHPTTSRKLRSGIYLIRCKPTGKVYVGSAVYIKDRWSGHRRCLRLGTHYNALLQRSWNKYSPEAFEWVVIEHIEVERLIEREQHYIDLFRARERKHGFNFCQARSPFGRKLSAKTKAKLSESHRKMHENMTPEERARRAEMSRKNIQVALAAANAANLGATRSPESRAKMAASHRGKKQSDETRAKRSESLRNWHRNLPPETREKQAEQKRLMLLETRAKREAIIRSPGNRARAAELQRGKKPSLETRMKMSDSQLNLPPETLAKRMEFLKLGHSPESRAKAEETMRKNGGP